MENNSTCLPFGSISIFFFIKDGFAEFTPDTLNVLAEQAVNLDGVERSEIDALIANAEKELEDAGDDAKRFMANSALEALRAV